MANVSYRFDPGEWEKKPRKPFRIKKTWARNKLPGQPSDYEINDDGGPPGYISPPRLRSASPPSLSIAEEQSVHEVPPIVSKASVGSKTSTPTELRRIIEHMPSLRNSPASASRRRSNLLREIGSASSSRQVKKVAAGQPKRSTGHVPSSTTHKQSPATARSTGSAKSIVRSGKGKQSLSSSTQNAKKRQQIHQEEESAHSEPVNAKTVSGSKRRQPSSSSAAPRAKKRRRAHQDEDSSQSGDENESVSGQEVELWMCSKRLKRTKSDLCEIDLAMSSLRDIAQELYEDTDTDLEQQALHQVVKKSMESLWKLIKESAAYKNMQLELKKVNGQLQKSRVELLAKGKERNQKLMRLSTLRQRAGDLAMCEQVKTTRQEIVEQFNALKQNLTTTPTL